MATGRALRTMDGFSTQEQVITDDSSGQPDRSTDTPEPFSGPRHAARTGA